jgi:hypothetical protein
MLDMIEVRTLQAIILDLLSFPQFMGYAEGTQPTYRAKNATNISIFLQPKQAFFTTPKTLVGRQV